MHYIYCIKSQKKKKNDKIKFLVLINDIINNAVFHNQ